MKNFIQKTKFDKLGVFKYSKEENTPAANFKNQIHTNNINTSQNINKNTDIISTLIHEYLYKKDYTKTLDSYQEELGEKIKSGK